MEYKALIWMVYFVIGATHCMIITRQDTVMNRCAAANSQANTLNIAQEKKVVDSFTKASSYASVNELPDRFETSDIVVTRDEQYLFTVFDNSYHIGAFCNPSGSSRNCTDRLLAWPDASLATKKSSFEGITYNPAANTYFVAQEAVKTSSKKIFRAIVFEIRINPTATAPIQVLESCTVNFDFSSDNKGVEGLEFVHHQASGKSYLLGLCEANECDRKSTADNQGRILVLEKREANSQNDCSWEPVGQLALPTWVHFNDYSAVSIKHKKAAHSPTYIAVTSQEMAQVWIGEIAEIARAPYFSLSSLPNQVTYALPKTNKVGSECMTRYCNIEGVAWLGENQLVFASDEAKADQDASCIDKDQSVQFSDLPVNLLN